ncbi:MAG: GNAT family N-acetyltransferase [Propionibacteriales bacterium]|nr:GNAT family N-acetyltransferase [Propionibacteriales bacterium]
MLGRAGEVRIERLTAPDQLEASARSDLVDCWVAVTNAGGAVGFPHPPVTHADVHPAVKSLAGELSARTCILFRATQDETLLGWVVLSRADSPLVGHWGLVQRLQTDPRHRGRGIGAALMQAAEQYARDELGLEQLHITVRAGLGLEDYYARLGWREVGRWPSALRLGPDDVRDEVLMFRSLDT